MQAARITVTVDGGTERWLKYLEEQGIDPLSGEHDRYVPDLITGDMDSCSPSVIEKLGSIGSTVVKTPDQNDTDYTKALLQVAYYAKTRNINVILQILVVASLILVAVCDDTNDIFGSWVKYTYLQKRRVGSTISSATSIPYTKVTSLWEIYG